MFISCSNNFKPSPVFVDDIKEFIKYKIDPSKVIQVALQVFALFCISSITYLCPPMSIGISVTSFLLFHPIIMTVAIKTIKVYLTRFPSFAMANEKITPILRKLYYLSRFRIISDICRLIALGLTFQPISFPLLIANGTMIIIDLAHTAKAQAKIHALIKPYHADDAYLLREEHAQISQAYPELPANEILKLGSQEKKLRPMKEKFKKKQIQWISTAWASMLDNRFNIDDASDCKVFLPLAQLSVIYELDDKNVFLESQSPPSSKKRYQLLQQAKQSYKKLNHSQKNTLKSYIMARSKNVNLDVVVLDLFRQIGALADTHLRASPQLQKGMSLGAEKHYFWTFQIKKFLHMQIINLIRY